MRLSADVAISGAVKNFLKRWQYWKYFWWKLKYALVIWANGLEDKIYSP